MTYHVLQYIMIPLGYEQQKFRDPGGEYLWHVTYPTAPRQQQAIWDHFVGNLTLDEHAVYLMLEIITDQVTEQGDSFADEGWIEIRNATVPKDESRGIVALLDVSDIATEFNSLREARIAKSGHGHEKGAQWLMDETRIRLDITKKMVDDAIHEYEGVTK